MSKIEQMTLTFRLTLNRVSISQHTMKLSYKGNAYFVRMLKSFSNCEFIGEEGSITCHCDNGNPHSNGEALGSFDLELAALHTFVGFLVVFPRSEYSSGIYGKTVFVIPDFTNLDNIEWKRTESFADAVVFSKQCWKFRSQLEDALNPEMHED